MSHEFLTLLLTARQICDIELILNGGFFPISTFMGKMDYESVVERSRLSTGEVWPIPIVLDISEKFSEKIGIGTSLELQAQDGTIIAIMSVNELYRPNRIHEVEQIYGTKNAMHPGVDYILGKTLPVYVSGNLQKVHLPVHYDFCHLRDSPQELREKFAKWGWTKVVGFQTRNPMHRAHQSLTIKAAESVGANLLIHPAVGTTKPGDIDHFTRVRCYEHLLKYYPKQTAMLSLLPLSMRMAGPKEALWHAIIRKNFGCTHFIVGRDHAGPGKSANGESFYNPYAAHKMISEYANEIGIIPVTFREMVYIPTRGEYVEEHMAKTGEVSETVSGTEIRRRLQEDIDLPPWFTYPEIITELRKSYPPLSERGFTVFFTGYSGAGKSTIAHALMIKLMQIGGRSITLLDGDLVRKHLSSELGFSREHRDINIMRIAFVASEITKAGGIAICAPIAPFENTRKQVAELVSSNGGFILVFVKTPLGVCESRDRKNLYSKARAGIIPDFTGISSPYEIPEQPDLIIDTITTNPSEAAQTIILKLEELGYLR